MKGFLGLGNKATENEPKTPKSSFGDYLAGFLISGIFLAIAFGGATLVYNGFPHKKLPDFVPLFGVACILGGLFVAGKILGGVNEKLGKGLLLFISVSGTLFGMYISLLSPGFSILQGPAAAQPSIFDHTTLLSDNNLFPWVMACYFSGTIGGLFAKTEHGKKGMWIAMMFAFGLAGTSLFATHLLMDRPILSGLGEYGIGAGFAAIIVLGILLWEKSWRALDPAIVASAMFVPVAIAVRIGFEHTPASWVVVLITVVLGGVFAAFGLRSLAAQIWIGKVHLTTSPERPKRGDAFFVSAGFKVRKDVELVRIVSDLVCNEVAAGNPAADESTEHTEVMRLRLVGGYSQWLKKGTDYSATLKIIIPQDADPSSTGSLAYHWVLETKIVMDGIPDWEDERHIEVLA